MKFRILSLDGGGVWALIQVRALMALYPAAITGHQILKEFDLVVANSGGSIVLGGLVEDIPLQTVLNYFEDESTRRSIFQNANFIDRAIHDAIGIGPKYSTKAKLPALQRLMPKTGTFPLNKVSMNILSASSNKDIHLLITAFDYDRNTAAFFRSASTGSDEWGWGAASEETLAEAIHASTNAPVNFFDAPADFMGARYWDGAITGCNNPVLAGVTEAIMLKNAPTDIVALSLGTGGVHLAGPPQDDPPTKYICSRSVSSLRNDLGKLATCITDDPPDIASFLAHVMTGGGAGTPSGVDSRVVRMNPMISPEKDPATNAWRAPGGWTEAQFDYLANHIGMDALDQHQVDYISDYAELWLADVAPNQPLRMKSDSLEPELGYGTFGSAKAAWEALR